MTVTAWTEPIALVRFTSKNRPEGKVERLPWTILASRLTKHEIRDEKDGAGFSPTLYREGPVRRLAENVEALTLLVLDIDDGTPLEDLRLKFEEYEWVAYTTHGHTTAHPKYRLVFPLTHAVPAQYWRQVWSGAVATLAPGHADRQCKNVARLYYFPVCPHSRKAERWAVHNQGRPLAPDELAAAAPPEPARAVSRNGAAAAYGTGDYTTLDMVGWFKAHGAYGRPLGGDKHAVLCPWVNEHSEQRPADYSDTVVWEAAGGRWPSFFCSHAHCEGRGIRDVLEVWDDADRWCSQPFRPPAAPMNGCACGSEGEEPSVVSVVSVVGHKHRLEAPQDLEPEALYGLPGDLVRAIQPHTESHPAAVLASFLSGAGCLIGPGPHVYRDGAQHTCNEFICLVGTTGSGRKGTATRRTNEVFLYADNNNRNKNIAYASPKEIVSFWQNRIVGGLGSGEALVRAVSERDERIDVDDLDRRRLVFESEFSKALKVMRREGSTLSENLRDAWDGEVLANRVKGQTLTGKGHVSVLGHVTFTELMEHMGSTQLWNGFANRFLWFCTRRVQLLPFGGGKAPLAPIVSAFHRVLDFSQQVGEMEFDEPCKTLWDQGGLYKALTERPPGLLGAVTTRAEAHVTRLALLYAVLDLSREIHLGHLLAGLAVWDYSERSCAHIFGTSTGDDYADTLLELLAEIHPGGLTRTELRDRFARNAPPGRIPRALEMLQEVGKIESVSTKTGGRPAEYWRLVVSEANDQNDINDESPLQRARRLVRTGWSPTTETT